MTHWFMMTVVGKDRPGIVAHLSHALYEGGCNLGEASMMRLGGNFTIMLMVQSDSTVHQLEQLVAPVTESMGLRLHVDRIEGGLHRHQEPDVRVTVYGADRAGIVARVTGALAEAGLHILDMTTDVGGSEESPIYVMLIEGEAAEGAEALQSALDIVIEEDGVEAKLESIETLLG